MSEEEVGGLDRLNLELKELNKVLREIRDIIVQHCPESAKRARELRERRLPDSTRRA